MAANEPIPFHINGYSRTETDLKLENLEQRLDAKLEKIITEIGWLKGLLLYLFFPFCLFMLTGLIAIISLLFTMLNTFKHIG